MQGKSDPNPELMDAAALCGQLVPESSTYAVLAKQRLRLFPDEMFADLFTSGRGRPSVPGDVMATALVLKELEGLSDRQAADALRCSAGRWPRAWLLTTPACTTPCSPTGGCAWPTAHVPSASVRPSTGWSRPPRWR